ncbi:hypothetical protein BDV29DRAFT_172570 [Aspergillus leporis]|jgi:hypothetical protein|uniref:Uncharacterized protein n=1 Tax=Aspergillus leporis TaxID=41062 RepID=A0A5N5X4N0_9EURO|nr:hypothetical protein BDV29DRAFT_172570 [Aspergillus leporis]
MPAETLPITFAAFAEAVKELPLSSVYAKASELRNSIAHLRRSNEELKAFVDGSCDTESEKRELENYIAENDGVMVSMQERIVLLKSEIESRGQQWVEVEVEDNTTATKANGDSSSAPATTNGASELRGTSAQQELPTSTYLEASGDTQHGQEQDGVYL